MDSKHDCRDCGLDCDCGLEWYSCKVCSHCLNDDSDTDDPMENAWGYWDDDDDDGYGDDE